MEVVNDNMSATIAYDYSISLNNETQNVETELNGTNATFTQNGSEYTLTALTDTSLSKIIIPATYNSLPVTGIANNVFKGRVLAFEKL